MEEQVPASEEQGRDEQQRNHVIDSLGSEHQSLMPLLAQAQRQGQRGLSISTGSKNG